MQHRPVAPSRKTQRGRVVRAAFVMTVSVGAVACGDADSDGGGGTETNPPMPAECPASEPTQGTSCDVEEPCTYHDDCGQSFHATCEDGTWDVAGPIESCNPPAPCPDEVPEEGTVCPEDAGPPVGCVFAIATACGLTSVPAECVYDESEFGAVWSFSPPTCTPTEAACDGYTDPSLCDADTTCRWLVPGCADPPTAEFEAGCFPILDCGAEDCGGGGTCTIVTHDPCWNSDCDACGEPVSICLSPE